MAQLPSTDLSGRRITNLSEWLEQRRKNYPTKARIEAKLAAEKAQKAEKNEEKAQARLEKQQQRAERLRKELAKVESSIKRKREQQDEGDEMRSYDDDSSSDTFDDGKSDDEKPETLSSRPKSGGANSSTATPKKPLPPPPTKADPSRHCKYYSTGGTCGKKGKCRFVHDEQVRNQALAERARNGGRMTIKQRLILNDQDQEDLAVLKAIQHLKELGRLDSGDSKSESPEPVSTSGAKDAGSSADVKKEQRPATLPAKPQISLPSHVPPPSSSAKNANNGTARYQGWNLNGYGNPETKSEQ